MKEQDKKRLRRFGLIMALMFALIGCFSIAKLNLTFYVLGGLAIFFALSALLQPQLLKRIEYYWLMFGEKMSVVMSYILLIVTYFLIITPMSLLMRILGKRPLDLRFKTGQESYWIKAEVKERYRLPY
ncbi:MAG: hypothetical protein IT292_03455 [Deltaproteobacteria bacterium]|nr:hypothetical protein [Deltaproteobacteria bacterium]